MKSPARSPHAPGNPTRGRPYDRHSAMGTRGLPKKKGAGGKGVWGAMVDMDVATAYLDKNDPNYDSEEEEDHSNYYFENYYSPRTDDSNSSGDMHMHSTDMDPPFLSLAVFADGKEAGVMLTKDESASAPSSAR